MIKTTPGTEPIEEDIRSTRDSIGDKMERIQERLSPGDIIDSVIGFARDNGGAVAGSVGRTVRDHPLPLAMIGAGIVWLAMSSRRDRDDDDDDYYSERLEGESRESFRERMRQRAAAAGESLRERASELGERAGDLGHRAGEQARRVGRSGGRYVKEHPILVGAAGVVLGAAIAASLPRTWREDSVFGERAERAREAAREAAVREGRKVQEAAKAAVEKAREAAERKAPTGEDLKRDVERTAKAATGSGSTGAGTGGPTGGTSGPGATGNTGRSPTGTG